MARGLQQTKRRIASVTSTKKITGAMKLVATAKLKVYKNRLTETKAYAEEIAKLVRKVFAGDPEHLSHWQQETEAEGRLYLIVTSSLGLCAGYNFNVFELADGLIGSRDEVLIIGSKGAYHYRFLNERLHRDFEEDGDAFDFAVARELADRCLKDFLARRYRSIEVIYTEYLNSLNFKVRKLPLLPLPVFKTGEEDAAGLIMEPDSRQFRDALVPVYLKAVIYGKLIEAVVSEHASRRTAMENATDNAEEILEELKLTYNKDRQAMITREITEVVSGANAQ